MAAVTADAGGRRLVDTVLRARELSILAALIVLVAVTTAVNSSFLSAQGVKDIFLNASILVLLAGVPSGGYGLGGRFRRY